MSGSIRYIQKKSFAVVQFLSGHETSAGTSLEPVMESLIGSPRHAILNLAGVRDLDSGVIEKLHFLDQQLKTANKKMRIVFAEEPLRKTLAESRFGKFLSVSDSLNAAIDELSSESDLSSRQFIKAFVNATLRTFYVQARTHCKRGAIYVKSENKARLLGDVSGVIHVLGPKFSYGVMLSFPKNTFLKLITRLMGETSEEINQQNQDAAAELMNIIFGQAKLVLNLRGAGLKPQLPTLSFGNFAGFPDPVTKKLVSLDQGKTVVIPFEADIGELFIEVWMPETAEGSESARLWFGSGT